MPLWQVWTLRDGKAVRWRIFRSKQEALEVTMRLVEEDFAAIREIGLPSSAA